MKKTIFLIIVSILITFSSSKKEKLQKPSHNPGSERELKQTYLRTNALKRPLRENLIPVHIYYDASWADGKFYGPWSASGTLILRTGKPWFVVTNGHVFHIDYNQTYHCACLIKGSWPEIFPLEKAEGQFRLNTENKKVETDIAIAFPEQSIQSPAKKIKGFSSIKGGTWNWKGKLAKLKKPLKAWSVVTGDEVSVIGGMHIDNERKDDYFVVTYKCLPSESGTGFLTEEGKLLVISGSTDLTDQAKKILGLDDTCKGLSYGLEVKID